MVRAHILGFDFFELRFVVKHKIFWKIFREILENDSALKNMPAVADQRRQLPHLVPGDVQEVGRAHMVRIGEREGFPSRI